MNTEIYLKVHESAHKQELERVRRFVGDVKNDIAGAPFFLNLFAPQGFGKTVLLEQIWKEYERVLPASFVRVGDFRDKSGQTLALNRLLVHIVDQLGVRVPSRVVPLPNGYQDWTDQNRLTELVLGLVSGAKEFEKTTLLLIDDYDIMPSEQRRWFQENILSPASRTRKVAVALTTEMELRFTESFELRMRLECRRLTSLDPEAISRALPQFEEISGKIYRITGGLPLLTEEFLEQLVGSRITTPADFQAHAQELTGKYYRTYVEDRFLASLSPDIRDTMLVLAVLRRFDVKVLKRILPELLSELYHGFGTADYLDLIDHMRPWVEWRPQGGYALDRGFRLMLEGYVLTIRPDVYKRANRAAEVLYREWLESNYSAYYLVELLYHVLALHRAETNGLFPLHDEMSRMKVGEELIGFLTTNSSRCLQDVDSMIALRNSLEQDTDLRNFISEDVKNRIDDLIAQKSKEVKSVIQFPIAA